MKVTVCGENKVERKFPCLLEYKGTGTIYYASTPNTGMDLSSGKYFTASNFNSLNYEEVTCVTIEV